MGDMRGAKDSAGQRRTGDQSYRRQKISDAGIRMAIFLENDVRAIQIVLILDEPQRVA